MQCALWCTSQKCPLSVNQPKSSILILFDLSAACDTFNHKTHLSSLLSHGVKALLPIRRDCSIKCHGGDPHLLHADSPLVPLLISFYMHYFHTAAMLMTLQLVLPLLSSLRHSCSRTHLSIAGGPLLMHGSSSPESESQQA